MNCDNSAEIHPVLSYFRVFGFVGDAEKLSNANNKDDHSQFFSFHSISTI
jgi:hypothetical protein